MRPAWNLFLYSWKILFRYGFYRWSLVFPVAIALPAVLLGFWGEDLGLATEFLNRTGTANYLGYALLGALYWNFVEVIWSIAFSLERAMRQGVLESLLCTRISRLGLILGWSGARLAGEILPSAFVLAVFLALSGVPPWPRWALAILVWLVSLAASYGFAFLLFGLTLRFKDADSIVQILGNSAPLLGGVFFSVAFLPQPLRALSLAFPFTYGVDALRALWLGTKSFFPLPHELGLLGLLAVGYLALGWWALLRFERLARHHGLEGF
ncbi:MAG: ABC transporter permease [Candidatus Bipolaricaulaceae bacterium]